VTLGSRDFFWFQVRDDWAHSRAGAGYSRIGERRG